MVITRNLKGRKEDSDHRETWGLWGRKYSLHPGSSSGYTASFLSKLIKLYPKKSECSGYKLPTQYTEVNKNLLFSHDIVSIFEKFF